MATVYLAQDLKHDRKVALKVLKAKLAAVLGARRQDVGMRQVGRSREYVVSADFHRRSSGGPRARYDSRGPVAVAATSPQR